ncbi:MAG: DNA polymerase III subunit gamma/tau [Myxococcales bacterium]|nr:DNA polymerase III subunit gamma/tau [Polyangiaceae bacterium]MDW8249804.1 DNA polymerase III subunit gamma/tau [Myxococcales bacterium]
MSYLVLARKWRPQTFHDLVGQDHVRRTLENAIAQNRVAHAFLFTGVRGVGKTTSARILAKALNCKDGPTTTPCLRCEACVGIAAGTDLDVRELDGASNNSVDDVRRLQEELPYRPVRDRFKIYIVDEVHMLSSGAWNAFLKTLEEPPPHVKFIFATTEVHKIPVTILSRCQRYDFRMISAQTIAARLQYVLAQERIFADDAAIRLIAREAAGSMRDAMSLLDQAIAWSHERLIGEEVARVLGVASRSVLHQLAVSVVGCQPDVALRMVAQLVENGYDLAQVARDFLAVLRDLVVAKVCAQPGHLLDLSEEERQEVRTLAERTSSDDLIRLHQSFARAFDDIVRSPAPRASLEMTLVRLARRPPLVPLEELMERLADLERRLGGGPTPSPVTPSPGGTCSSGNRLPPTQAGSPPLPVSSTSASSSLSLGPQASAHPLPHAGHHILGATALAVPLAPEAPSSKAVLPPPSTPSRHSIPAPPSSRPATGNVLRPVFPASRPPPSTPSPSTHSSTPTPASPTTLSPTALGESPPSSRSAVSVGPPLSASITAHPHSVRHPPGALAYDPSKPLPEPLSGVDFALWRRIVEQVRNTHPALASVLELASPRRLGPAGVTLGFPPNSFEAVHITKPRCAEPLARALQAELGPDARVFIELSDAAYGELTLSKVLNAERWERQEAARKRIAAHPLVQAVIEELGGELKDIKVSED